MVDIYIEVESGAIKPTYAHEGDGAMDLYAKACYVINPHQTLIIGTGIKVAIPKEYAMLVQPRSGLSVKTKLRIPNSPGLIDSLYRDEVGVIIENTGNEPYIINRADRIAQIRLVEAPVINWIDIDDIKTIEGDRQGGFGSSGK